MRRMSKESGMNLISIAACCGLSLAVAAPLAHAQNPRTEVPRADANATGNVSLAEYQKSRETFLMRADANRDGVISRPEWDKGAKVLREDLELNKVKGAERIGGGTWWTALDANKDGNVTRAEIKTMTAAQFGKYDLDRNGLVSSAEAQQVRKRAQAALP
jgi:hypothetical protein